MKTKKKLVKKPKKPRANLKAPPPVVKTPKVSNKRPVSASKPSHYVDKADLMAEIIACQAAKKVSDKLADMFGKIIDGVSYRFPNIHYYGISDDVKQDCHLLLLQKFMNFNTAKNTSCFAYFTTVVYNQMRYQLSKSKRYKDHKDHMVKEVIDYMETNRGHILGEDDDE